METARQKTMRGVAKNLRPNRYRRPMRMTGVSGVADAVIQGDAVRLVLESTATAALETLLPGVDGASLQSVPMRYTRSAPRQAGQRQVQAAADERAGI